MSKRMYKKQQKPYRNLANNILNYVRKELENKYKFSQRLVGSGALNTMIKDDNEEFDLDYQILLTHNSKEYIVNELKHATKIKNDFLAAIQSYIDKNGKVAKVENSTTALTYKSKNEEVKFHIDFVIIKALSESNTIIRRNIKKERIDTNEFTWNELPKYSEAYTIFKNWTSKEKLDFIENIFIDKKINEKSKEENDETKISSSQLFIREVINEYKK